MFVERTFDVTSFISTHLHHHNKEQIKIRARSMKRGRTMLDNMTLTWAQYGIFLGLLNIMGIFMFYDYQIKK